MSNILSNIPNLHCTTQDRYNYNFAQKLIALLGNYDYVPVTGTSETLYFRTLGLQIVGCQNTAATTITLPLISTAGKMIITIKDEALNITSADITINPSGSDNIEGTTTLIFQRSGGYKGTSITLYNDNSSNWYLI